MESLSEFWKNVKDRVRNPFVFSFVVLWILYNWKITIGLFFMNSNDFRLNGYSTLYQYLDSEIPKIDLWKPLRGAVLYCVAVPFIKEVIRSFNAFVSKIGSKAYFWISNDSKVPFDQFMDQIRSLDKKTKDIDTLLEQTQEKDKQRQAVSIELENLKQQHALIDKQLVEQQSIVNKMTDTSVMNGVWLVTRSTQGELHEYDVVLYDGEFHTTAHELKVHRFFYDDRVKLLSFHLFLDNGTPHPDPVLITLKIENSLQMRGTENGNEVKYRRLENQELVHSRNEMKILHKEARIKKKT